ncbi:hypothetical protein E4U43_008022 [Claviceps pusilla]|uniref:Polyprenal reductase n=1 Tax=Claviceps pusilla TaxID=123648 RepID=A0A9P7NBL3_9HYPO|nr:hypothetical protein E4U43_008022 [Claviceps pusilla]
MDALIAAAAGLGPSNLCQGFFLGAAGALLVANGVVDGQARGILFDYGARREGGEEKRKKEEEEEEEEEEKKSSGSGGTLWKRVLGMVRSYGQVPHAWFWHFYLLSAGLSVFWAWQYLGKGSVMGALAEWQQQRRRQIRRPRPSTSTSASTSTELGRVYLAWGMMAAQGSRRLFECFFVSRPGKTPMLAVHWALALAYYTAMSVAVWVEGSGDIIESWHSGKRAVLLTTRVPLTLAVFLAAWLKQNECHRHLASLKKYTLPDDGLFKYIVCPHYTCECVIYLAISAMAAPSGSFFNRPVLCGLLFVVVNLGITASGTKQWYADKFGGDKVANKWRMIPGMF